MSSIFFGHSEVTFAQTKSFQETFVCLKINHLLCATEQKGNFKVISLEVKSAKNFSPCTQSTASTVDWFFFIRYRLFLYYLG